MMCSSDHFASNNHMYLQPNHQRLPGTGIMEACDLERTGHEQSRHGHGGGQEAEEHRSDPCAALTTYLTFLEHKVGHLRGILCSTPRHPQQQRAIVSAELRCIIVQLVSIANDLASDSSASAGAVDASPSGPSEERSPSLANATHDDSDDHAEAAGEEEEGEGPYEVVQIEKEEILAPHAHCCKVCGKGFKRDANLRMHMRGHGDQYKAPGALARPGSPAPGTGTGRRFFYSCPYAGCKRNREHREFQPLKTPVCVKNHYRRSHCDKSHVCRRCGVKRFSVLADLRTHEKHCGRDRWVCSCGVSFSRKDKLFAHVAVFDSGHTPALPPNDDEATGHCATATVTATAIDSVVVPGSGRLLPAGGGEAMNVMDQSFSGEMLDGLSRPGAQGGMDDGRTKLSSPIGIDFCDFDGFDLLGAVAMDFNF